MKFGVVEYTSKTGTVWRHTDERPNYLCDPQLEIDPTSFGCYVSALKGEHIPLTGLIVGPVHTVSALQRLYRRSLKRLQQRWPAYSIEYVRSFDVLMVVHQLTNAHEITAFIQRVKKDYPHIFIIGVPTQPFGILLETFAKDEARQAELIAFMNECHVFLTITKEIAGWYQQHTTTPVAYLPQPYPASYAQQFYQPRRDKKNAILVAGVTQRNNTKKGQRVARHLQQQFPHLRILVPRVEDLDYDFTELEGSRFDVLPFEKWQHHLTTLAQMKLVINTDYTFTRGRVQTDCAAVGTPSLGANSDGQVDLFPTLASTPDDSVETLVTRAANLLRDDARYDEVVVRARRKLREYDYPQTAQRIAALVETYRDT